MKRRHFLKSLLALALVYSMLAPGVFALTINVESPSRPNELDVRGAHGVPKGTALRAPAQAQLKALESLRDAIGVDLIGDRIDRHGKGTGARRDGLRRIVRPVNYRHIVALEISDLDLIGDRIDCHGIG